LGDATPDDSFDPLAQQDQPVKPQVAPVVPQAPHVPATHTERRLTFGLAGKEVTTQNILPWYDDAFKKKVQKESLAHSDVKVQSSNEGTSLIVSGNCDLPYYVVLMFRSVSDYINKPNSFVSNVANSCNNGTFSYDHGNIPSDTPAGTYYLLVAEEGQTGPWIPLSSLIPITIDATTTTVTVE
jgi:hypothetical protein